MRARPARVPLSVAHCAEPSALCGEFEVIPHWDEPPVEKVDASTAASRVRSFPSPSDCELVLPDDQVMAK
eukprot:365091-Chlamydomonas_euryale.AAC.2